MNILYPAKYIQKPEFSGKLIIDGDLEDNCILFRFMFDTEEMVHPLLIWVRTLPTTTLECTEKEKKNFVFECNIPDYGNQVMKTSLIFPNFSLKEHKIWVTNIESQQISCKFFP